MNRRIGPLAIAAASVPAFLLVSLLGARPALAVVHRFVEDFTTTQRRDAVNTTAWWDTVAGELKLYPFAPAIVGTYNTAGNAWGVKVEGDHAYVADFAYGLQVIDITDPTSPTLAGSCETPGYAYDVAVAGNHAFVADGGLGLQVIDISDPTNPTLAGSCDTPGTAYEVAVAGDWAFVADGTSGLQVIDISDPTAPTLAGGCDTPGQARGVVVAGDWAFVADYTSGLQVIDIGDPAAPTIAGTYDTPSYATGIAVAGDWVFVADYASGLLVIDIGDPTSPVLAGTCDTPGWAWDVDIAGDRAIVADYNSGLEVIDISDPAHPTLVKNCDTSGQSRDVAVVGELAFLADYTSGLQVIRISQSMPPAIAGACATPSSAQSVVIAGDHAYVADSASGLQVIDISDPLAPVIAGASNTPGSAVNIAVAGDNAFVADGTSGLQVIDISDPTTPVIVGACDTPGEATGVAVDGDHAFVADGASGLQVIDISDPTAPAIVGVCDTPGTAKDVAVSGDFAFVADGSGGLQVVDVSDPGSPTLAGSYVRANNDALGVAIWGDHAVVANGSYGIHLVNISDPTAPTGEWSSGVMGAAADVAVSGSWAFVAALTGGLYVRDNSDAASIWLRCDTPGIAGGVAVSGEHVFLADDMDGLQVVRAFQDAVDPLDNVGQSLALDSGDGTIVRARLVAAQTDTVSWEFSADGGVDWQGVAPSDAWTVANVPGTDLLWRSTHWLSPSAENPAVANLEIGWLYEGAAIDSIVDVPADQGGWVRLHFTRSGRDFADEVALPVANYGIWQRVDGEALLAALDAGASSPTAERLVSDRTAARDAPRLGGLPVVTYRGRTFVRAALAAKAASFPPGTWEWEGTVPGLQQECYLARVPTAADSSGSGSNQAVFLVTAHTTTPSVWYVSEPDSGYSVDNIAPATPGGFVVAYGAAGNDLSWLACPDEDFHYFRVYRGATPDFTPGPENLAHETTGTGWADAVAAPWSCHYKVSAVDFAGNESAAAAPDAMTGAPDGNGGVAPSRFALLGGTPNPFNPVTTIAYTMPRAERVTLTVFDLTGRAVRRLVDEERPAGAHEVRWDGTDGRGQQVASGVYVCRMEAGPFQQSRRLTLVK